MVAQKYYREPRISYVAESAGNVARGPGRSRELLLHQCVHGLREGARTTGPFAGACDAAYVARCRGFLIRQLQVQRPHLILALGTAVPPFLAALSPHLAQWTTWINFRALDAARLCVIQSASFPAANHVCGVVALTHPCLRGSNVFRRRWRAYKGDRGGLEMVRECLGSDRTRG
jgi:hypothetical protein